MSLENFIIPFDFKGQQYFAKLTPILNQDDGTVIFKWFLFTPDFLPFQQVNQELLDFFKEKFLK